MDYLGDFVEDSTVYVPFTTNDGSGGAVAPSTAFEAADIVIYKDNSATQKTSANGVTMTSPFDTITGLHLVTIDTSNDTGDVGFWTTGSDYTVVLSPDETVDGQTIVHVLAQFSIQNRYMRGTDSALLASDNGAGLTEAGGTGDHLTAINLPDQTMNITGNITGNLSGTVGSVTGNINTAAGTIQTLDALDTAQDTQHAQTQSDIAALNNVSTAQVNAEVDTALGDYDAPTYDELLAFVQLLARSDAAITTDRATQLSAINANQGTGVGDYAATTESQEALRDWIGDGTNLTEAGGTGDHLTAIDLPNQTMDITGNLSGSVGSVTGNVGGNVSGSVGSVTGNINTAAGVIQTLDALDTAQDTQHAQTQSDIATVDGNVDTILVDTAALNDTALPDSVPADGALPTLKQAVYMITQFLTERAVSSTTVTVKKVDGTTSLMTFTLDDATTPTSITRAT